MTTIARRDFLLLRTERDGGVAHLSCEQLYMRWVDARADGTTAALFARLAAELAAVAQLRVTHTSWLADDELRRELDAVLEPLRARGGRLEY